MLFILLIGLSFLIFINWWGCRSIYRLINKEKKDGIWGYIERKTNFLIVTGVLISIVVLFLSSQILDYVESSRAYTYKTSNGVRSIFFAAEYLIYFVYIQFLLIVKSGNKKIKEGKCDTSKVKGSGRDMFDAITYLILTIWILSNIINAGFIAWLFV